MLPTWLLSEGARDDVRVIGALAAIATAVVTLIVLPIRRAWLRRHPFDMKYVTRGFDRGFVYKHELKKEAFIPLGVNDLHVRVRPEKARRIANFNVRLATRPRPQEHPPDDLSSDIAVVREITVEGYPYLVVSPHREPSTGPWRAFNPPVEFAAHQPIDLTITIEAFREHIDGFYLSFQDRGDLAVGRLWLGVDPNSDAVHW
jgi:hypothetical protein